VKDVADIDVKLDERSITEVWCVLNTASTNGLEGDHLQKGGRLKYKGWLAGSSWATGQLVVQVSDRGLRIGKIS
jgi:hypothetical protein